MSNNIYHNDGSANYAGAVHYFDAANAKNDPFAPRAILRGHEKRVGFTGKIMRIGAAALAVSAVYVGIKEGYPLIEGKTYNPAQLAAMPQKSETVAPGSGAIVTIAKVDQGLKRDTKQSVVDYVDSQAPGGVLQAYEHVEVPVIPGHAVENK